MKASMDVSMGGRAAEEIVFGAEQVTGGASSDLQSATAISEQMVRHLGMSSKVGLRVVTQDNQTSPGTKEVRVVSSSSSGQ